jgi:2'-5' RNA ligase
MRAFIAIDLPEPVARRAGRSAAELSAALSSDARWTRPEGIHLTLKFLGEISDAQTKQVVEALAQIGPFEPFSGGSKGVRILPPGAAAARVLGRRGGPAGAGGTRRRLKAGWKKSGLRAKTGPFRPTSLWRVFKCPAPSPRWRRRSRGKPHRWGNLRLRNFSCLKVNCRRKARSTAR